MRVLVLAGALTVAACAAPRAMSPVAAGEIAFTLTAASGDAGPILLVALTNRSQADVCIRAELLQNPYTYEMDVRLRDRDGRPVRFKRPGFVREPHIEAVRIAPGAKVQGRYDLAQRFKLPGEGKLLPRGMAAQATARYDACDGSLSRQASSDWQPI